MFKAGPNLSSSRSVRDVYATEHHPSRRPVFTRGVSCSLGLMQGLCQMLIQGMMTAKHIPKSIGGPEVLLQDNQPASGNEFIHR